MARGLSRVEKVLFGHRHKHGNIARADDKSIVESNVNQKTQCFGEYSGKGTKFQFSAVYVSWISFAA